LSAFFRISPPYTTQQTLLNAGALLSKSRFCRENDERKVAESVAVGKRRRKRKDDEFWEFSSSIFDDVPFVVLRRCESVFVIRGSVGFREKEQQQQHEQHQREKHKKRVLHARRTRFVR
jgi:hypothetical protein